MASFQTKQNYDICLAHLLTTAGNNELCTFQYVCAPLWACDLWSQYLGRHIGVAYVCALKPLPW